MMSQYGKQITTIHILPIISRSKGNQTMKFYPLIEYNMKNIFLEKSCTKCGEEKIFVGTFLIEHISGPIV